MKEKCCLLLIVIILCGSLIVFQEPQELEEREEEIDNMVIYGYKKVVDIGSDYYPINTHLCVEYGTSIYFVPFQNTLTIYKLNTTTGAISLIVTEVGAITKFFLDRTGEKLYYYQSQSIISYVDLTDDSITDLNDTLPAIEDIFVYDAEVWAVDTSEDDLTFYKYTGDPLAWAAQGTIAEGDINFYDIGVLGNNDAPLGICWDGTYFYVVDNGNTFVYKYNAALDTLVASYDIGALGDNDNPNGICWDGSYFYVTDGADGYVYKYNAALDNLETSYNIGALGDNDVPTGICWDETYFYVVDVAVDKVFKYNSVFDTLEATYDIGALGGNDTPFSICWDGVYFYVTDGDDNEIYKYNSDFTIIIDTFDIGALGGNDVPTGICWNDVFFYVTDGDDAYIYQYISDIKTELGAILYTAIIGSNAYIVYQYITTAAKIYIKDLTDNSNPTLLETLDTDLVIPYLEDQRGIAVSSDSDTLYFVMKDSDDLLTYLCTYKISTDTFTKSAEYNISLMLDRNTNDSNALPNNLEKGFGVESGVNDLDVFQIARNGKYLYKIADLTNITGLSGYVIVGITDTYLIVYNSGTGATELWKYQDMSNHITLAEINHPERDFPTCEIIYDIRALELTSDMFVQIIGTLESVADQVIFEGYVEKPELLEEKGRYIYIALLKSPAFQDLDYASPSGEYSGRSDEHITDDIADNDGYITAGTLSEGQALGTFLYAMDKDRRIVYNELGAGDQFTWALTPVGGLLYNNGAVDSAIDYSEATPIWDVHISYREVRVNWVQVKGAFVDGVQVESTVRQNLELQQQYGGKIKFKITIGFINTVALANAWGDALLALLSAQMTEVIFKVRDTTNGFIQPSKEITLAYSYIPVIASAQFKINQITHDDRSKITEYVVSNILRYEIDDFKGKLAQDNQEILYQINSHIVGHAGLTNLTGWDINTAVALSFNDGTRTFTATPTGTITYYIQGIKYYLSTAETVVITDTEGLWYIYFDGTTLTASQTPWEILDNDKAMVSILYWDATNNKQLILTQQLHSHEMDAATHERLHDVSGMQISSGGTLSDMIVDGDASLDTYAQFQNDETIGHDEDLEFTLSARAKATNLPVFYRDGVDGSLIWRTDEDDPYPIANTGVGGEDRAAWNELTGGSWQLTEVTDSKFVLAHIIATTDADRPFICLVGQAEYASKTAARTGAETELTNIIIAGLTTEEFRVLATIIIQTKDSYANTPKSKIVSTAEGGDYIDWTATLSSRIGIGQVSQVSNDAYDATEWDVVEAIAPSKNAVRDKFESIPKIIHLQINGSGGYVESQWYGRCLGVANSDVNAIIAGSCFVKNGGTFKLKISILTITATPTNNKIRTLTYLGAIANDEAASWNLINASTTDWLTTIATVGDKYIREWGATVVIGDNEEIGFYMPKTANDGAGTIYIYNIWLERQ